MILDDLVAGFAADLEAIVAAGAWTCDTPEVWMSAGEPAAFAGNGCAPRIWVWLRSVYPTLTPPLAGSVPASCAIATAVEIGYRFEMCYSTPADGAEADQTTQAAEAACLHEAVGTIWCGLAALAAAGTLAGIGDCEKVTLGALEVTGREGGVAGAAGTVQVEYQCPPAGS